MAQRYHNSIAFKGNVDKVFREDKPEQAPSVAV